MALNFNVGPYYDDFDPNKNFHRILFKPGYAVQARELTQSQTILQDQISKFADHVFQKNTPVSGGKLTYNTSANYIKVNPTYLGSSIDITLFENILIQNTTGDVVAKVLAVAEASSTTGGDPDTLIISYISGTKFKDDDIIYSVFNPSLAVQALATSATGSSSVVSISEGVFYVVNGFNRSEVTNSKYSIGHFVNVLPQTIVLDKYDVSPNLRIGLNITETIYDYVDDVSLLDPAEGAPNFQGPGADRYEIILTLETRTLSLGDDQSFIELMRIENGLVKKQVDGSVYATIDDYFAKRTFDTNGDYVVNDFKLTPSANTSSVSQYDMKVSKGVAYVRGYRVENQGDVVVTSDRARTTDTINNNATFIEYGNYLFIDSANGVFDVTTMPAVDLHLVAKSDIATTNATTYAATVVGTSYIRGLEFDYYTSISNTDTYVYKAYLTDIENKTLSANAISGTSSNITFPGLGYSAAANAYYGVTVSIDKGTSAGDVKRIVSYNGTTRTATVDTPWSVTPDTSSVFTLRFDTKDIESVIRTSSGTTIAAWSKINTSTGKKTGLATGDTLLQSKVAPELIYKLGYPYASAITDATYETTQVFRNVAFNGSSPTITPTINFDSTLLQFLGNSHENYIVINQSTGAIISFADTSTRHITLSNGNKSLVLQADDLAAFTATIIVKASVSDATDKNHFLKVKNLITANTTAVNLSGTAVTGSYNVDLTSGQVYIQNAGLVTPGQAQTLYVSDVKRIVKIIDTKGPTTTPTDAMLLDATYDVTHNFAFNNGQKDGYYGHSSIKLIPGRPKPTGKLLVLFDYYQHTGGDGYFSVASYLSPNSTSPENYGEIGSYTAKSGITYNLRDSLDFRPTVKNAQALFVFDYTTLPSATNAGIYIPVNNSVFYEDYTYYLGRKDKLILSKDRNFEIIQGTPSVNPLLPVAPDGSLIIANLTLDPYTNYVPGETTPNVLPNLSIEKVQHRRWTMQDISDLQTRVNNIEYYTALNALEKNAQGLQVADANGLNRFKNGILVDDFSSYATADTNNADFNISINRREKKLTASQTVDNFPLQSSYLNASVNRLNSSSASTLGFKVNTIGQTNIFTLPYTSANLASQPLASNTININPFASPIYQGVMSMNPPMDNWVDNTKQPDLLIVDPDLQLYQSSNTLNTLSVGDWKVVPGTTTTKVTSVSRVNHGAFNGVFGTNVGQTETTTQTYGSTQQTNILGYYDKLGSSYNTNNGYITDISIMAYIRSQQVLFRAKGLLTNAPVNTWFDGINVDDYITNPDVIELTSVSGTFKEDDIIGYYDNSAFFPIATVVAVYTYPTTTNVRLYVVGNLHSTYVGEFTISQIQNGTFDSTGAYVGTTAHGTITTSNIINVHKTGFISTVGGSFQDVIGSYVQYYRVAYPGYGWFSATYGIWGSPKGRGALPAGVFNYNVPTAGSYTLRISTDDAQSGYLKINGVTKWTSTIGGGGSYNDYAITLPAGTSNIAFSMTTSQDDGDAYLAAAIYDSTGSIIFATNQLPWTVAPTKSGTMTELPGGGFYFSGATQVSLNGLASATDDYYKNSTIKINTSFISVDPFSGHSKVIPTTYTANITQYIAANTTAILDTPVNISLGTNTNAGGDISSFYTIDGTHTNYKLAVANGGLAKLSTDEAGNFVGVFNIPPDSFKTGERVFRVDNRTVATDPVSASTYAEATFTASGLATKSQALEFAPSIDAAKNTFTQTNYQSKHLISTTVTYNPYDPVAQSFIVDANNFPNGAFLKSIKVFFYSKPTTTNTPVTLSIVGTQNGYPNGDTLAHSIVTKFPNEVKTSTTPHRLDSTTYTEFEFEAPVYIQSGTLYAFILKSISTEYIVYIAGQNAQAISSSVKNLPTDPTPSTVTKIGTAPYVGSLFESQNAMTWTADQGKSLMFVIDRCVFDTTKTPKLPFIIPKNLPYRKLTSQEVRKYYDANSVSNVFGVVAGQDVISDAYNITTSDFVPSATAINYSYKSTLNDAIKTVTNEYFVSPGKFGCPTYDDIYLNDGLGERVLVANTDTSFTTYSTLLSTDDTVSPIISDDGLSLFNIRWNINDMELSDSTVTIIDGGTGYNVSTTTVSISPPDDIYGVQAYATANVAGGIIDAINFITTGSGYLTTPTITIEDATTRAGNSNTTIVVHGETSSSGGNGLAKYFTKKVVLTPENDSGDLRVFYTAYRPFGTNISVYYKILNRNDIQAFDDGNWQLMTPTTNSNVYSQSREDVYEFEVAPGVNNTANNQVSYTSTSGQTYTTFSQFAIKIVLSTSDKTNVPYLSDIRALALPSGTGL